MLRNGFPRTFGDKGNLSFVGSPQHNGANNRDKRFFLTMDVGASEEEFKLRGLTALKNKVRFSGEHDRPAALKGIS